MGSGWGEAGSRGCLVSSLGESQIPACGPDEVLGEYRLMHALTFCPLHPSHAGNGIHSVTEESTSPVISSPPRRQHSISYPHHGKTRKGSRASSIGYTAFSPRPSLSRHSSIATNPPLDRSKVKDYLLLSVLACFCPVWPINIVGFVYSIMVRTGFLCVCVCVVLLFELFLLFLLLLITLMLTNGLIFSLSPRTASSREIWTAPCAWDAWPRCSPRSH